MIEDEAYQWRDVGAVADWAEGSGRVVGIGARRIGVYRVDGRWYALKDPCPHAGVSLCAGANAPGALSEAVVTCPGHGWRFELGSGLQQMAEGGIRSPARCTTYPVRITDADRVEVGV